MNWETQKSFFETIKENGSFMRLGKTFRTEKQFYYFDTGTGKVLQCSENVYLILKQLEEANYFDPVTLNIPESQLLEAVKDIKNSIEAENIMKAPFVKTLTGEQTECLEQSTKNLKQICLELTEKCNLRCDYCIYHEDNMKFRNYGSSEMDFKTAKKAIDYFFKYVTNDEAFIAFYGGEPLLKFDLLKQCVDYILGRNEKALFTMTTNGTLLTPDIAEYLSSIPNFNIVFSIDGDKFTHDRCRKTISGNGSFDAAFAGFKNAIAAYGDKAYSHISINTVVSPPFDFSTFDRMQDFFDRETKGILKQYSYVEYPDDDEYQSQIESLHDRSDDDWQPVFAWQKNSTRKDESLFTWEATVKSLLIIHKRLICEEPVDCYKFNGCCVPGGRKLYVTTHGKFKACERMGESPDIGDVDNGLNIETINKYYVDNYIKSSVEDCNKCWAVNLCGLCYATCFDKDGINLSKKRVRCEEQRFGFSHDLSYYHQKMEEEPASLDFLNERVIR